MSLTTSKRKMLTNGTYKKDRYKRMAERWAKKQEVHETKYQEDLARQISKLV